MSAMRGAAKGALRGLILLLTVALVPGLPWLAATYAEGTFDLGFKSIFFGALALEIFLGAFAFFELTCDDLAEVCLLAHLPNRGFVLWPALKSLAGAEQPIPVARHHVRLLRPQLSRFAHEVLN